MLELPLQQIRIIVLDLMPRNDRDATRRGIFATRANDRLLTMASPPLPTNVLEMTLLPNRLDSNEAWVTPFHEKRTNAHVTIGSHLRGGLL
jgi:hypothetical protein